MPKTGFVMWALLLQHDTNKHVRYVKYLKLVGYLRSRNLQIVQ